MKLSSLTLKNFKCFSSASLLLHPRMNVLVGVNGTGKSSMLEALRVATGALFLGVDKYEGKIAAPGIIQDDVRLENLEPLYPTVIEATGSINTFDVDHEDVPQYEDITWIRSMDKHGGRTTLIKAKKMTEASERMQKAIRENRGTIPLVAYYTTERYKKERKDYGVEADGSRLRGYFNSLDSTTNIKFFQNLFFTETLDATQKQRPSDMLAAVVPAIMECVKCEDVYYDFKKAEIVMVGDDGVHMPMHLLSDGVRSVLSLVMELAFRSYLLNPHKGANAPKETDGVVLIDEIDLHLHPEWQLHILNDLQNAFPKMQFIVTTHAPLVVSAVNDCCIYSVADGKAYDFPLQYGQNADHILQMMGVRKMKEEYQLVLNEYLLLIESGMGHTDKALDCRHKLEEWLGKEHAELKRADMMMSFFS